MSLTFEEAINKINGQKDKHVQNHVQELGDGNTTRSQPISFMCPGRKAKIIIFLIVSIPLCWQQFYSLITVKHNNPYNSKVYSQLIDIMQHVSARIGPAILRLKERTMI
jgi:hypothetical protein